MSFWASGGNGRVQAALDDEFFVPYGWKYDQSRRALIWCHGAGGTYAPGPIEAAIAKALNVVWVCPTLGPSLREWGSDASLTEVTTAWTYAKNNLGVKTDKYLLWGGSMGGLTAILKAIADPTHVAAAGSAIPAIDPQWVHDNDPATSPVNANRDAMETVYGGATVPNAKQAYLHGVDMAATGIPCKLWPSSSDTFTPSASTSTFVAASGCQQQSLGAVGHSYLGLDPAQAIAFLAPFVS